MSSSESSEDDSRTQSKNKKRKYQSKTKMFQQKWLDMKAYKGWLKPYSDPSKCR